MQQSQEKSSEKELTAREIFNRILKGQVVRIPNDAIAAEQLKAHLNVMKSREKKYFLDRGLDFICSVISVEIIPSKIDHDKHIIDLGGFEIKLIAPKHRRTFTAFIIKTDEPVTSSS